MNVLYEEDGTFRCAEVLADQNTSLQVELPSGKRAKVKSANVLLRFESPGTSALIEAAERQAEAIEVDFLWEVCAEGEFGFLELARDYYGHEPDAAQATAILLRVHGAPIYFHRKGRGRFRRAPPEILQAALTGLERKRQQAATIERMAGELAARRLPAEFAPMLPALLYKPDRNRVEAKALELASAESGLAPARLLQECGAIASPHDYHLGRFLFEYFAAGTAFPAHAEPETPVGLPAADAEAFSIDDAATTEIDDAFSVSPRAEGGWRIGIHIAGAGLGIRPGSGLDAIARQRLSTVYMPGRKITMLPDAVIDRFTLAAGRECEALSLYLDIGPDFTIRSHATRAERVRVAANLRHHDLEPRFNEEAVASQAFDFPFGTELSILWQLAVVLEAGRGKPAAVAGAFDYNFSVDWSVPEGRVEIVPRRRGSPLDKLVAELMIVANSTWGGLLAQADIPAIYRAQSAGKVRMTTAAAAHDGLGVDQYAWASSPLRRYVDLINQWQLLAHLRGEPPPFGKRSEALLGAMRDFELTYAAYAEFQRAMERYWCLRWLEQEDERMPLASVLRDNLVRLERVPLVLRVPSVPALAPGSRVRVSVDDIDYFSLEARLRFLEALPRADEGIACPSAAR
ncbi:MAG TPA: ribonuclease II [Rhodocyclaceae bacterium]|nr:MAG: ribonuclease II [Betaproteobacteria bacterium CG2_30_68_42]HCX33802.1 ribonuclease II [Rhodocyclaceae bacterium]